MIEQKDVGSLAADLKAAAEAYIDAKKAESHVRARATDALNNLNQAQKAFDEAIKMLRDAAPHESDWKLDKRCLRPVEAA